MSDSISNNILDQAKQCLIKGEAIILPTETVYGIAVDATNNSAIEKIYQIKGRKRDVPLQLMCSDMAQAEKYAIFNQQAKILAQKFFPGALTLVVHKRAESALAKNMNIINETIGIRIPDHALLKSLLESLEFPMAVSSANRSGSPAPNSYAEAVENVGRDNNLFAIDGGEARFKIASTVVDITEPANVRILRHGAIRAEEILAAIN